MEHKHIQTKTPYAHTHIHTYTAIEIGADHNTICRADSSYKQCKREYIQFILFCVRYEKADI